MPAVHSPRYKRNWALSKYDVMQKTACVTLTQAVFVLGETACGGIKQWDFGKTEKHSLF